MYQIHCTLLVSDFLLGSSKHNLTSISDGGKRRARCHIPAESVEITALIIMAFIRNGVKPINAGVCELKLSLKAQITLYMSKITHFELVYLKHTYRLLELITTHLIELSSEGMPVSE